MSDYNQPPPQDPTPYGAPVPPAGYSAQHNAPMPGGVAHANSGLANVAGLGTVKLATLGQRALARIVDAMLLGAVAVVLFMIFVGAASGANEDNAGTIFGSFFILIIVLFFVMLAYEPVMIAVKGATLGKMLIGIKVISQVSGGNPGWGSSFMRLLIPAIANFFCGLGLLVYLSPIFDKSGLTQGWHDSAANTLVISTK